MAVGNLTQWPENVTMEQLIEAGYVATVFRNDQFLGNFPRRRSEGSDSFDWRVNSSAAGAEVFTEGAAAGVPNVATWEIAKLAYIFFRATTRLTGHTRRANRASALPPGFNVIRDNMSLLLEDILDLQNTTFLGSSNNGIGVAVDSSTTYAGITRPATTDHWASYENALGGALTWGELMDMKEAIRDNERGGRVTAFVMPHNQLTNLQTLPVAPGGTNSAYRIALDGMGQVQLAPSEDGTYFGESKIIAVPDATNTEIYGLDMRDWFYVEHPAAELGADGMPTGRESLVEVRNWYSGNDDVSEVSVAGTIVCVNPRRQGKSTGVTA